jgi:hypothetical protein
MPPREAGMGFMVIATFPSPAKSVEGTTYISANTAVVIDRLKNGFIGPP